MQTISDIPDGPLGEHSAAHTGDAVRERVLALTSTLRSELDQLAGRRDATAVDRLRGVGGAIVAAGARAQLAPLVHSAEGFCNLARGTWESTAAIDGLLHAVGLIERVLDGCLAGMDAEHLGRLCGAAREVGLDDDADDALDLTRDAAPRAGAAEPGDVDRPAPPPARDVHEQELFDAFAAEALDILDQCEDQVLRCELDPHAAHRLDDVGADLATVRDAAAAVGLRDLDPPVDAGAVDALLDCIDVTRQRIEEAWADSDAAGVDPSALLPVDELFLRLRRTARDVAHRHGGLIALDPHGGALRITAALADRVYEPFARMIADAASHVVPGGLRALRLRVERDDRMLALIIDEHSGDPDGAGADAERPEALYWIDARRSASDDEAARLVYRPGSVNVVQVITG
jgi:hypothetical protein